MRLDPDGVDVKQTLMQKIFTTWHARFVLARSWIVDNENSRVAIARWRGAVSKTKRCGLRRLETQKKPA
jgi:hypothetical protein